MGIWLYKEYPNWPIWPRESKKSDHYSHFKYELEERPDMICKYSSIPNKHGVLINI